MVAAFVGVGTLVKGAIRKRSVVASGTLLPSLGKMRTKLLSLSATAAFAGSMAFAKSFGRAMVASVTGSATLAHVSTFRRAITSTVVNTAAVARVASLKRALAVTASWSASLSRVASFGRTLSASATGVVSLVRSATYKRAMNAAHAFEAVLEASQDLALEVLLQASATWEASLNRAASLRRTLSASASWVASLAKQAGLKFVSMKATAKVWVRVLPWRGWKWKKMAPRYRAARLRKQ